jgi:hypothetical protein
LFYYFALLFFIFIILIQSLVFTDNLKHRTQNVFDSKTSALKQEHESKSFPNLWIFPHKEKKSAIKKLEQKEKNKRLINHLNSFLIFPNELFLILKLIFYFFIIAVLI